MARIAVIGYKGGLGKTALTAHMLAPRMPAARPIYAVESINGTAADLGLEVLKISGEKFKDLFRKLALLDDAIIDVGGSNVEDFFDQMTKFEGSCDEIDCFMIPVTSGAQEQKDAMKTIATLADFGIGPEKIRVVFNKVDKDVEDEFGPLLRFAAQHQNCTMDTKAAIFRNDLFDLLDAKKTTIDKILADDTDYKALARGIGPDGDQGQKARFIDLHVMKSLAKSVARNLEAVYPLAVPQ